MRRGDAKAAIGLFAVISLLLAFFVLDSTPAKNVQTDSDLPQAGFEIEQIRSEPNRSVRRNEHIYVGPIMDTHAHLDPPREGHISKKTLRQTVESINQSGVDSIIIMPVPNEGHMTKSSNGVKQRRILRHMESNKIKLFCGSGYISNWLHDAYHHGYRQRALNKVLGRLSKDLDDSECLGIGEIGLYHFNKDGIQNVIAYPPTFEPFLTIMGRIAQKGVWIDLHAEPVDPHGNSYEHQVFGGLELLFQNYPNLRLILSHTAMTNPTNARAILKTYPNVMMNFKPIRRHDLWKNLEPITNAEGRLYDDWAELFEEMPERFMVGADEKFGRIAKGVHAAKGAKVAKYEKKIKGLRKILGSINPEAAELIAYKNAKRILK